MRTIALAFAATLALATAAFAQTWTAAPAEPLAEFMMWNQGFTTPFDRLIAVNGLPATNENYHAINALVGKRVSLEVEVDRLGVGRMKLAYSTSPGMQEARALADAVGIPCLNASLLFADLIAINENALAVNGIVAIHENEAAVWALLESDVPLTIFLRDANFGPKTVRPERGKPFRRVRPLPLAPPPSPHAKDAEQLARAIDLTPEQTEKVTKILDEEAEAFHAALRAAAERGEHGPEGNATYHRLSDERRRRERERTEALLTPAQRKKFTSYCEGGGR